MAKTAGTTDTDKVIPTHMLLDYVRQLLEQLQADMEHPTTSQATARRKFVLTHPHDTTRIVGVKHKCTTSEGEGKMTPTELIELNPPAPHLAKRQVQTKYRHTCALCGGEWIGEDANPVNCAYCRTRTWRTGETKWDQRRAKQRAKQAQ